MSLLLITGIDISIEAISDGYNMFEFRKICCGTIRIGVRTTNQPGQISRGHFYWYVKLSHIIKHIKTFNILH